VRKGAFISCATGMGIGLSDYGCYAPQCLFDSSGPSQHLIPFDVYVLKADKLCPQDMCVQVIEDEVVRVDEIASGGGIFIDDATLVCGAGNPYSPVTAGAPSLAMDPTQTSVVVVNQESGSNPLGVCGAQATLSSNNPSENTLMYSLTSANMPPWITLANPSDVSGAAGGNEPRQILYTIATVASVTAGITTFDVTVSDWRTAYSGVRGTARVAINAIPRCRSRSRRRRPTQAAACPSSP
jgi:hypothetical protein